MPKLFVIMPFGRKELDHDRGQFDFDQVYTELIRPAALNAGFECLRIDEVLQAGLISDQYLREIFAADIVLADISLPNGNVYYELGIRHAISAGATLLVALNGTRIPFDLVSQRVIFYEPDSTKWIVAKNNITQTLLTHRDEAFENPIRRFLERIAATVSPREDPVGFERDLAGRIERCRSVDQLLAVWQWARKLSPIPQTPLIVLADRLAEAEDWSTAVEILRFASKSKPNDFEVHRKLGWCLQFLGPDSDNESELAFKHALDLNPNDPETLGMMGGRCKRLGQFHQAAEYYAQGARISPSSLYMLVNEAAMSILADPAHPQSGIARYANLIERIEQREAASADEWTELVWGEAQFAVGNQDEARRHYASAIGQAKSKKSITSAARQLDMFAQVGFRPQEALILAGFLRNGPVTSAEAVRVNTGLIQNTAAPDDLPVVIHLSDIHFGSLQKDGKAIDMHRFYEGENSQPLSKHILDEFTKSKSHFSYERDRLYLIISGDLTYTGTEQEYTQALKCLNEMCGALNIDKGRVHIVPGNHDINWQLAAHNRAYRFDHYLKFLIEFFGEDLFRRKFPKIVWPLTLMQRPFAHDILEVDYHRDASLLVVGLNTCVYETEQHHYGFVGEAQLKTLRDLVADLDLPRSVLRVAVLHHHLHPFPELLKDRDGQQVWLDLSTIRDAGFVERSLERLGFDIVLHGHKHKPQLRESLVLETDPSKGRASRLIVCGAGSVSCTELESNTPNHYEVIEFQTHTRQVGADFARIEWRVLPVEPGAEWTTLKSWVVPG
jgi:3',5'-cyclic AMP phosphodiesterase CpdA/Flp pilus assembly protein TadD